MLTRDYTAFWIAQDCLSGHVNNNNKKNKKNVPQSSSLGEHYSAAGYLVGEVRSVYGHLYHIHYPGEQMHKVSTQTA